jgi:hypothetical protein
VAFQQQAAAQRAGLEILGKLEKILTLVDFGSDTAITSIIRHFSQIKFVLQCFDKDFHGLNKDYNGNQTISGTHCCVI